MFNPSFTVEREEPNRLRKQVWVFGFFDHRDVHGSLLVTNYHVEERETTRQKYRTNNLLPHFYAYARKSENMDKSEVPLPDDVAQEVREALVEKIRGVQIGIL